MPVEISHERAGGFLDSETTEAPPIAVNLAERAFALAAIMDYLNKANKTNGSKIQAEMHGSEFVERYEDKANSVQRGAENNTAKLRAGFLKGVETLAATSAMEANGLDPDYIELVRLRMQSEINKEFGVGKANAKKRATIVEQASQHLQ